MKKYYNKIVKKMREAWEKNDPEMIAEATPEFVRVMSRGNKPKLKNRRLK